MNYTKNKKLFVYLLIGTTLYLLINMLVSLFAPSVRMDFTENRLFTLSDGAKKTLAKIEETIELHFFFSEKLSRDVPGFATYGQRVSDLLDEMTAKSNGKIKLYRYNPKQYSVEEEQANIFGIQPIPIEEEQVGYFGLAGKRLLADDVKLIEFFHQDREAHLEYDITRLIHSLSKNKRDVIGVMSSLPIMGDIRAQMSGIPMIPWSILAQLRSNFDLINLPEMIDDLPESINTMIVVHPRSMNERAIYEFEQFLFHGGKAIVFIDPKAESDRNVAPDETSSSSNALKKLFDVWGLEIPEDQLVADRSMALRINAGTAIKPIPAEYIMWLGISPKYIMQDDPVTNQLQTLNFATSGYIKYGKDTVLKVKPLIKSSKNSGLILAPDIAGTQPNVIGLLESFTPDNKEYVLAAKLTGNVTTAFPDGSPPRTVAKSQEELKHKKNRPQLMHPIKPINVILIADSDLLQDRFWLIKQQFYGRSVEQQISGNGQFIMNAIENLTGSDELLELRARGGSVRPFEKIEQIKLLTQIKLQDKQRELQNKLKQAQSRINELKGVEAVKNARTGELEIKITLTVEQRNEIESMRGEMLEIRKQLRDVQFKLNADVVALENWLQFINIGLVAILILIFAFLTGLFRSIKHRHNSHNTLNT